MDRRRLSTSRGLDRFIPHRPSLDVNVSHARLMSCSSVCTDEVPKQYQNMNTKRYRRLVSDALHITDGKILPMTSTPDKSGRYRKMLFVAIPEMCNRHPVSFQESWSLIVEPACCYNFSSMYVRSTCVRCACVRRICPGHNFYIYA